MKKILIIGAGGLAVLLLGIWLGSQFSSNNGGSTGAVVAPDTLPYQAGPFRLGVDVEPETPVVGENRLRIALETADGEPVEGAGIRAVAEMPAMGSMPAMQAPAKMNEVAPGIYEGMFDLSMGGAWPLTLHVEKEGLGQATVGFGLATGREGLELSSGATRVAGKSAAPSDGAQDGMLRAGPYRMDAEVEPESPRVGENLLMITLAKANGKPLPDAKIRAVAEMPAMGSMPAMQAPADMSETAPGIYEGTFDLSMKGAWPLTVTVEAPGLPAKTVGFDMATGRAGLAPSAGFSGGDQGMEEAPQGTVTIDPSRRQLIGVKTDVAEVRPLTRTIRAVGEVVTDERRLADVSLKYEAWIGELYADFVGAHVERGDVLFTAYSPDLYAAQQEYLQTYKRKMASDLLAAARQRLEFWDVSDDFIKKLESTGKAVKYVPVRAPRSGTIVTKDVVEGTSQPAGKTLMRIADLSQVWIEAEVYETDLPLVDVGMAVEVSLPYAPGKTFEGKIDYIYPYLAGESRTGRVRLSLANPGSVLKPDMFADVKLKVRLPAQLAVPESAVIIAGETRVVFEDLGGGRLAPRIVKTGRRAGGWVEIVDGLEPGDEVVTSGNFLIASESQLKAGIKQW
ncbi:MAG: efflux RND transporter periplasmic adaptor subunit [Proteobacteria bacterium]|nr:efflux RND transporter periplasmic adaptor subunit [Pseudomonadota bacterium]